ncbi:Alpha-(1,6)-fucosyltransferase [Sparganum proliferum]
MDKAEYCTKLGNLGRTRKLMRHRPSAPKKLVNNINNTIGKLRKAGALTRRASAAKASDTAMARFYGAHRSTSRGCRGPHRLLTWYSNLWASKWLYQRLCFLTKDSEWTVKSAEEFSTRIKHLEVEADEVMVSFDVISLFTSIPPALAIDTIDGFLREKYAETDQQLKRAHIIELLELCLKTFFTFNGQVYEQNKGTPMGSPLSGLIAEAVLRDSSSRSSARTPRSSGPDTSTTYLHLLVAADFLVCTASSNICRLAYELLSTKSQIHGDAAFQMQSVDKMYECSFSQQRWWTAIADFRQEGVLFGDRVSISSTRWDGFAQTTAISPKNRKAALPAYLFQEIVQTVW